MNALPLRKTDVQMTEGRTKQLEDKHFSRIDCILHTYMPLARSSLRSSSFAKVEWLFCITWQHRKTQRSSTRYNVSPSDNLLIKPWSQMELYLSCPGVCHFFVQADVQVVARLIGQEEANGNCLPSRGQANVDLQLGLEDAELPQATPIAHHHAPHGFFDLKTHEKNFPHLSGTHPPLCHPSIALR